MVIMVQGTMSNAGKSVLTAGLIRVFKQDGYTVAPFKSQNMALNSCVTASGAEMGRAQAMQAEAAGIEPDVRMNPVLLKPNSDTGSQVIVMGKPIGNMSAVEYFEYKPGLKPIIKQAFDELAAKYDIIVIEGAGSPAEINLRENDIVNMGLAELVDAPVILVGDIDRGGVFAQLYGTVAFMLQGERERVKGFVINKFRGDVSLLKSGLDILEAKCHIPTLGVVPYTELDIDDEDSLSDRLLKRESGGLIDIAVIRLGRLSNFTDLAPLECNGNGNGIGNCIGIRYVSSVAELKHPDAVIIPGSKNTVEDMQRLRECGLEAAIQRLAGNGVPVLGICGGYQMLGRSIADGDNKISGMGLLPVDTVMSSVKRTVEVRGMAVCGALKGAAFSGYEIHHGRTQRFGGEAFAVIDGNEDGCVCDNVMGTYVHGLFDEGDLRDKFIGLLCSLKGIECELTEGVSYSSYKQEQYDRLATVVRESLDMEQIYSILRGEKRERRIEPVTPAEIEARSMAIIESEMTTHPDSELLPVIKRAIHTTADFDYETNLLFTEGVVGIAKAAIKRGATIVTDTNMARIGINKARLSKYGCEVVCYMADEDVARAAKENGTTRAVASVDKAARLDGEVIYVVGNAPTALIRLHELMIEGSFKPSVIIGVPVGFVNVVEAKELIIGSDVPSIVARGRKGGSNLAAAIVNAIVYSIE
jgi:adenosylcobyric acid synthase